MECVYTCRIKVSPRSGARQVMSIGMFPRAEVARGHDWLWGDQDGKDNMYAYYRWCNSYLIVMQASETCHRDCYTISLTSCM